MDSNYTTSRLSWSPNSENGQFQQIKELTVFFGQFQQIKGLTGFMLFLMVGIALTILKYIKFNAKKILESKDLEEGVLSEITKLQEQVGMLSYAQRQKNDSSPPDYMKKYGFDPRICASCKDECPHDVVDGENELHR